MSDQTQGTEDALKQAIEHLESLSYRGTKEWLVARLNGRDPLLGDTAEDSLAYPVAAVYPHLSRGAREDILKATTSLVHDLAAGRNWTGRPGEELLLLIQYLAPDEARDVLSNLANSDRFRNLDHEVQYRVLQSVVSLQARMPSSFWWRMFRENPVGFAGLAFDGLAMTSVEQAIGLLPLLPNDESVAELIANALPGFVDAAGPARLPDIPRLFSDRLAELQPLIRDEIEQFCEDEGLPLEDPVGSDAIAGNLHYQDLEEVLFTLQPEDLELVGAYEDATI